MNKSLKTVYLCINAALPQNRGNIRTFLNYNLLMTNKDVENIAHRWFEAFNEHNLVKLLSLYDDQAQHYSPKLKLRQPETNGLITGKDALRTWWQDAFDRLPDLHYKLMRLTANDDRVFMEYIRQVGSEPDMDVAELLEIKDGKIVAYSKLKPTF
jgi:limonene-1,2-epoxide hydrolase